MMSQTGQKASTKYILPNISGGVEGNHIIKLGQLIKYNTRNIFPQKSYPKCG